MGFRSKRQGWAAWAWLPVFAWFFSFAVTIDPARAGGGTILNGQAESSKLGRLIRYTVYKPEQASGRRRLPVLYLLHGLNDNQNTWIQLGRIRTTLDRLIANKSLQPSLVVMPMAGNSWYVDDVRPDGFGPIAQAMTSDLISHVDRSYQTVGCRSGRAIAGLSMGGFGAIQYAFENPDKYIAAISLSGSLFSEGLAFEKKFSPRFTGLFGGVYGKPFNPSRFNKFNVFAKLDKMAKAPERPAVWLAAGDNDFPSILRGTVRLHLELLKRNIESELRVDDADHTWRYWREAIVPALKWLSPQLGTDCAVPSAQSVTSSAN